MKPIIEAKNLNFVYNQGKDNEYHALINISLDIYPEEFVMIFGPSGCGKSTMLNVIAGLEVPDSGSITVFDRDLITMTKNDFAKYHREDVGMVFQAYNLVTSLTVIDNVALPQIFVNVKRGRRNKWARQLLERFGILKHAHKIPTELSGGQQQRIGIARAIVNNPKIVLADEPVGNLDSTSAKNVLEILSELNEKEKKTIVMVTHNPENLEYAHRIIYMKDGVITHEVVNPKKGKNKDSSKEIASRPKSPMVELKDLMRAYQGLSPEQINILIMPYKSKVFANHFISTRNMEETKVFEEVIQRRLMGAISEEEFFVVLKRSSDEGGVGLDARTVEKIIRRVNRVIRMAFYLYQEGKQRKNEVGGHDKITFVDKAKKATDYLLKTCYHDHYQNLDEAQINRLEEAVNLRITGKIQKQEFYKMLDQPFKDGGVGLNSKTARAISEELGLILILGFGVVKTVSKHNEKIKESADKAKEALGKILSDEHESLPERENEKYESLKNENDKNKDEDIEKIIEDKKGHFIKREKTDNEPDSGQHSPLADSIISAQNQISLADSIISAQHREKDLKKASNKSLDNSIEDDSR